MFTKCISGFTLIEMIMAIVLISVGLTGVLLSFNLAVKSSADPLIHKQMLAIAEEMMEEILLKPYTIAVGTISGCNRSNADDVRDYNGYNQSICDIDGTTVAGFNGYNMKVDIIEKPWQGINKTLWITITVTNGGETMSLVGWRTDYAS